MQLDFNVSELVTPAVPSRRSIARTRPRRLHKESCLKKTKADTLRVKQLARYVITLTSDSHVRFQTNPNYTLNAIVVLAPCVVFNQEIDGVVLEIGLSRARPYRDGQKVPARAKVRSITEREYKVVLSHLKFALAQATFETVSVWKHNEPWFVKTASGIRPMHRGMRFTVDTTDNDLLCHFVSLSLVSARNLNTYIYMVNRLLAKCHYSYYEPRHLKKMKGPRRVADLFRGLNHLEMFELRYILSRLPLARRALVGHIGDVFQVPAILKVNIGLLGTHVEPRPSPSEAFGVYLVRPGGSVHAAGCFVFESYLKYNGVFSGQKEAHSLQRYPDDIPF